MNQLADKQNLIFLIRSLITYFFGSTPDDFDQVVDTHPFEPCPDSPNCTYHSVKFEVNASTLFEAVKLCLKELSTLKVEFNSQSLQIDAVFRIPLFGFKDDVKIFVKPDKSGGSILHIKSSSRIGESDLGVNRRRIKRILSAINQQIHKL